MALYALVHDCAVTSGHIDVDVPGRLRIEEVLVHKSEGDGDAPVDHLDSKFCRVKVTYLRRLAKIIDWLRYVLA